MKKKLNKIIIFLILTTVILEIVNIYFANKISTDSIYAQKINEQIKKLEEKNEYIKVEILQHTSLSSIASRAEKMGFAQAKEFVYLSSPLEIAVNPAIEGQTRH